MSSPYVLPAPADVAGNVQAAGLSLATGQPIRVHFHVHLSVVLMSGPIAVPGGVGIDNVSGALSQLHTHDSSGVIHVEGDAQPFTLGQFFTEWGQPLGQDSIGRVHSRPGYTIYWFVNGNRVNDPTSIVLRPHAVIVAREDGSNVTPIPPSYDWPDDL